MLTTSFLDDLNFLKRKLEDKEPFSITRFGDGEMMIMNGTHLNLLHKGEFNFTGQEDIRLDLYKSFTHNQENYFVGVACKCCVGDPNYQAMKKATGLPEERLTWANIFVNSNFIPFRSEVVSTFSQYKIILVSPGDPARLPFKVDTHISIGADAWTKNADVYDKLVDKLSQNGDEHYLVLLCAGPFANILCYKLFKEFPTNTIIDTGSVFNIELGLGPNRGYLQGGQDLYKTCIW